MDTMHQAREFWEINREINEVYENYAKDNGLTYTSLYILQQIEIVPDCTQKYLCEQLFLPKQTVNSIITSFYKQGIVELRELPEDRRHKAIYLSDQGREFSKKFFRDIEYAERASMEQIDETEREQLLYLMRKYANKFKELL